jgi:Asp/Glu/hydantoin racemase
MDVDFAHRRRTIHGVKLGILMLDTGFQRLPGDIGYGPTWPFPVQYAAVRGATPERVLSPDADGTAALFLRAADELVELGVDGITTSCGFLAIIHPKMVAHCRVPVATSSLLQIPLVQSLLPRGKKVGVLTASKKSLTAAHFAGVGVSPDLPVAGLPPDGVFIRNNHTGVPVVDRAVQEAEVLAAAGELMAMDPAIGAIVLECTNLPPYAAAIEAAFGVPVYDIVSMITWFHSGLRPRRFD